MTNVRGPIYGRPDNSEKIKMYIRDSENTMTYSPNDHYGTRFLGTWSKLLNVGNMLNWEVQTKYTNEFNARFNSKLEIGTIPLCFDKCVTDLEGPATLSSDEKNCVRECYLKRVSSRDDMNIHFQEKKAVIQVRNLKENLV